MLYRHKKTGNLYLKLFEGIDATNSRRGEETIVYSPLSNRKKIYVREKTEFNEKFEVL